MTDFMPPPALPPSHALLVPRPRRWWAIIDVVLFWLLFVSMFLPFARSRSHYGWGNSLGGELTGWQVAIEVFPALFALGGMGILFHFELRRPSRFRTPLHAFCTELFRLHLIAVTGLFLGIADGAGPLLGETKPLDGATLGLSALGLMAILQLCRLAAFGGLWRLLKRLYRRPPWKRWNWWLFPTVLGGGLVGIGAILFTVFFTNECVREFKRADRAKEVYQWCVMVASRSRCRRPDRPRVRQQRRPEFRRAVQALGRVLSQCRSYGRMSIVRENRRGTCAALSARGGEWS